MKEAIIVHRVGMKSLPADTRIHPVLSRQGETVEGIVRLLDELRHGARILFGQVGAVGFVITTPTDTIASGE